MSFIEEAKRIRLGAPHFAVRPEDARMHALLHLYLGIAARSRGFNGWERSRIAASPDQIHDLSGLRLFYDFPVLEGRTVLGFVRTAANKVLGEPVVGVQVTPRGWKVNEARAELGRLAERRCPSFTANRVRLACYSYPKLALHAELVSPDGEMRHLLVEVGDLTGIPLEPGPIGEDLGQVPYSLLAQLPEEGEKTGAETWDRAHREAKGFFGWVEDLEEERLAKLAPAGRLAAIDEAFAKVRGPVGLVSQRVIDYCCHPGGCRDHECFCLHPQENSAHCARASAQMMLCFWRFCYTQHEIAQAFGVPDDEGTPISAVEQGLEALTHGCFDAALDRSVTWAKCDTEIAERRPFMACVPGHARACAGTSLRLRLTPPPCYATTTPYLYIFDPWPPSTGAIYWENFNATSQMCMYALVRRTTHHA